MIVWWLLRECRFSAVKPYCISINKSAFINKDNIKVGLHSHPKLIRLFILHYTVFAAISPSTIIQKWSNLSTRLNYHLRFTSIQRSGETNAYICYNFVLPDVVWLRQCHFTPNSNRFSVSRSHKNRLYQVIWRQSAYVHLQVNWTIICKYGNIGECS